MAVSQPPPVASPPLVPTAPPSPRCAVGLQPVLNVEQLLRKMIRGALLPTVHILHRMCKLGEIRRLACPLRRFPFVAQPNCGGKVVASATKGGMHFPRAKGAVCLFSQLQASSYQPQYNREISPLRFATVEMTMWRPPDPDPDPSRNTPQPLATSYQLPANSHPRPQGRLYGFTSPLAH